MRGKFLNSIQALIVCVMVLMCFSPVLVFGQGNIGNSNSAVSPGKPLVDCDGSKDKPCDFQKAMELIQKIIDLLFFAATFIATAMFMYAGFLYLTAFGDTSKIQKAHGIFRKVLTGFLIMFLSFIIVRNLLKLLGASEFLKILG